jgi:hypothetical protein
MPEDPQDFTLLIEWLRRQYNYIFRSNHEDDRKLAAQLLANIEMLERLIGPKPDP